METTHQLKASQTESCSRLQSQEEVTKLAEKRKVLLDDIAMKYEKKCESHRMMSKDVNERHQVIVDDLHRDISILEVMMICLHC